MRSATQSIRALGAMAGLLVLTALPGVAATLWEFKFNETGVSPANTGTASPAPALVCRQAFYGTTADLHGSDGSGVSGKSGDRSLDLSALSTNGGVFSGKSYGPQISVANSNCTAVQGLTTLTLSGWYNALASITRGTYKGDAKLITFYNYSGGNLGYSVEFSSNDATKNELKVGLDGITLYFDITAVMNFDDTNKWYFWAVTYDGTLGASNVKLYLGTRSSAVAQVGAAQTANVGVLDPTTTDFSLNAANGAGTLKGFQDNVRVDNVVISLADLETRRVMDAAPYIELYGRGNLITNGTATPTLADGTDFGSTLPAGGAITNSFTISNSGSDVLALTGIPPVAVSGNAGDFTVNTGSMLTNIPPHASTTFKVIFAPTTTGIRTGTVSAASNVASKNPYRFSIKGNGIGAEPVIGLIGKGQAIDCGALAAGPADGTDFGGVDIAGSAVTNTFAITNSGLISLTLAGGAPVTLAGHIGDFTLDTAGLSASVAAGSSTTFRLIFDPATAGIRTGVVSIASDDADQNPFTFAVQGTGLKPVIVVAGQGVEIPAGDTTPSSVDGTDFGGAALAGVAITNVFTITNAGSASLWLTGTPPISITGHTSDFTVLVTPATNLGLSGATTFQIVFDPTVIGIRTGLVRIANNDVDRTPFTFSIRGSSGVATNSIPYSEPFESYPAGYFLAGTNGWQAQYPFMATITNHIYTNGYAGGFPIPGPHQMSLQIDGRVTNSFAAATHSNVWVDLMLEAKHWTNNVLPAASTLSNAHFAVCITTNRHLAVWNCPAPPAPTCVWTELLDTDAPADSYLRLTVEMAYVRDTTNYFHYRVWVNGMPSVTPQTWYAAANTNWNALRKITAEGQFKIDDLRVQVATPFQPVSIVASSLGYGAIQPAGTIEVPYGAMASFTNLPSAWYDINTVTVDGVCLGALPVVNFTNVMAGHIIQVVFAPQTAAGNTPVWWLAAANPAWTNDLNAAAISDPDGDGLSTWQEYIAGTQPTNPASTFQVCLAWSNGQLLVTLPTIATGPQHEGLNRYYGLEFRTNLLSDTWRPVPGFTNVRAAGQMLISTNTAAFNNYFYRGTVRLAP